ncbi:MAG: tRNA (adenosine(37)-N6)-threonylcarbamoyltransferase complex dimerization subunit type 1 TsaB [Patescibacteria group bacterium]
MILYLDTTGFEVALKLFDNQGKLCAELFWASAYNQSEELLEKIDGLLREKAVNQKSLDAIVVNPGPGSFTGVRIGVTTANFLAYGLNIPVLGLNLTEAGTIGTNSLESILAEKFWRQPVLPTYGQPPRITTGRTRFGP